MKKNLNKLATLALTGMMVAGMSFGAMADSTFNPAIVKIAKVLETDGKTYAPNTTFTLKVSAGSLDGKNKTLKKGTTKTSEVSNYDLKAGTSDQAALIEVTGATYAAVGTDAGEGILDSSNNKVDMTLDTSKLLTDDNHKITEPGVYVFTVEEDTNNYEGVVNGTDAPTEMLVVVQNKADYSGLEIKDVLFAKADGTKVESLTNYYGGGTGENDQLYDLTIEKVITGLGADLNGKFEFKVKVEPENNAGATAGTNEKYAVYTVTDSGEIHDESRDLVAGTEGSVGELKNHEKVKITGLSAGDKITVTEVKANQDGYTTTYTVGANSQNVKDFKLSNDMSLTVTNTKQTIAVTGVAMNIAPYAAMVLGAGAFASIFLGGKRRKAEDED